MRKLTKRTLAVLLSAIMAFPTILAMPFAAEAATKWTPIASSDFTKTSSVSSNASLGEVPTYNGKGSAMTWSNGVWTGNGDASKSEDGAIYIPDGYMYLTGYSGGSVPITGQSQWKIDFGFRFKTTAGADDAYYNSDEYSFLKMYVYTDSLSNPAQKNAAYCYFQQNANGVCYSWENDPHVGVQSQGTSLTPNNGKLSVGVNYHYVAEFTGNKFKAYVTDDSGKVVQKIVETSNSTFISRLNNVTSNTINSIKIGDDDNAYFFKGLEYRNITFYSGAEGEQDLEDDDSSTLADNAEDRLLAAIEKYEIAMDGSVKTNMTAAYDSYVAANKAYDAYKYGNLDIDLDTYATDLRKKVNAMQPWNYAGIAGVSPWFRYDYNGGSPATYAANGVSNILYWSDPVSYEINQSNVKSQLYYPENTVLLLDGVSTPAMPVLVIVQKNTGNDRFVYQMYPTAGDNNADPNAYFALGTKSGVTDWICVSDSRHYSEYGWLQTAQNGGGWVMGTSGDASTDKRLKLNRSGTGTNYWASMANVLKFIGTQDEYSKSYTVSWLRNSGNNPGDIWYHNPSGNIHVINYKKLLDTMNSAAKKSPLGNTEKYTQGGLHDLLAAYDTATAVNPEDYDYSNINNVTVAANAISTADSALSAASADQDTTGYSALRAAMDAKRSIYNGGSEGYKADSWKEFTDIYEEAVRVFSVVQETGYNSESDETATSEYAQLLADSLNALELVTDIDKVDSSALELAIGEADDAISNSDIFTSTSYNSSNIETVIENAKIAVWGAVDNYPNAKFKLDLNDTNTAIAEAQLDNVRQAIYTLSINTATEVATANNNSMQSAIALAANYSSEDYGNYADLASAVAAANNFVPTVNLVTKDCIVDKIAEYKTKTRAIINAINLLRPAFDKITNGTWGSYTSGASTRIDSAEGNSRWRLTFRRNNNVVVFRTEYTPFNVDLGGATFEWFTKESYDADLDSINIYDESTENGLGEIAKSGASFWLTDPSAASIGDPENYPGMLSASTEENSTYTVKNLTVSWSSAERLGRDMDGNDVNDNSFSFDEVLSSTQGTSTSARSGSVTTHNGTTYINGDFTVFIPRETKKTLSAETLPKMTEHTLSSNIGMVYAWKYAPEGIRWVGYSHNRTAYTQTTYVMNIAPLMELIEKSKAIQADEQQYKIDSWNTFSAALSAARANMNYGDMTAAAIEAECQTRYTNLWNAYNSLEKAATNASIHSAVEADEAVGNTYKADNKDARWSAARWATFKAAYEAAASAIANGGTYSDVNVRNYGPEKQSEIDAVATALTTAYNELVQYGGKADFTSLYNAAAQIGVEGLENDIYTVTSLQAVSTALANAAQFPYLNMTEAEKNAVYNEPENVQAIADEVEDINNLYATAPVQSDVDASALEGAKATAKASIKDPDAYGNIDEIKALIDEADISQDVEIYNGYTVSGIKYTTQQELDEAVTEILDGLTTKKYDVQVVDANGDAVNATFKDKDGNEITSENGKVSIDYGTRITIYAPGEDKVDWFYSYNSNTVSETASKYYTTDNWMHLTVKGNTTLTVKSAAEESETVKITYVNALSGKTLAVDYTEKDTEYTLTTAPVLAYYTFLGYSLEAESEEYVEAITPSEDTVVFANYEFNEEADYFHVYIGNLKGSITTKSIVSVDLEYNDLVELKLGDGSENEETGGLYNTKAKGNGRYKVNDETYVLPGGKTGMHYNSDEIYAWVVVNEADYEAWDEYRGYDAQVDDLAGVEKVVMFGDSYSFRVHENVYVIPYTQEEFNESVEFGYVNVGDTNNAAVYATDGFVNETNGQKISMIGNFTLPAGESYEFVEAGMLFKATTNGTTPDADLTLGNVGTNGIARMKSSQHTSGNQFVISVNTSKLHGVTINGIYRAYMIYTDGSNQFVVYSDTVTASTDLA